MRRVEAANRFLTAAALNLDREFSVAFGKNLTIVVLLLTSMTGEMLMTGPNNPNRCG